MVPEQRSIQRRSMVGAGEFMSFDTSGPDDVNRDLNVRFGRIMHLRGPTLRLKFRISRRSYLIYVRSARYNKTTAYVRQPVFLRLQLNDWEICDNWADWRSEKDPPPHATGECADEESGFARIEDGRLGARE